VILTFFAGGGRHSGHCPANAEQQTVHLSPPLGDRQLLDGACGDRPKPPTPNYLGC
jgi:hypothetical protein